MSRWLASQRSYLGWCQTVLPTRTKARQEPVEEPFIGPPTGPGQVLRCLRTNDGAMYQREICTTLEWSESKTSRVLSAMEEADMIERYRIGRQKIVLFPDERPDRLPAKVK